MSKYKCGLCGATHTTMESCRIPSNAKYYAWGYEWIGTPGRSDEICWVVPVANEAEGDQVMRYFFRGWNLRCAGGDKNRPCDVGNHNVMVNGHVDHVIVYRWAPDIVKDVSLWKSIGEPETESMVHFDNEEDDA